jgi:hypothetical protein
MFLNLAQMSDWSSHPWYQKRNSFGIVLAVSKKVIVLYYGEKCMDNQLTNTGILRFFFIINNINVDVIMVNNLKK